MTIESTNDNTPITPAITYSTCYTPVPSSVKHPATYTESFIPIFAELLADCSNVLDPFMGAGTTAVVAKKLNRNYTGFELNPKYKMIAENRLIKEVGLFL